MIERFTLDKDNNKVANALIETFKEKLFLKSSIEKADKDNNTFRLAFEDKDDRTVREYSWNIKSNKSLELLVKQDGEYLTVTAVDGDFNLQVKNQFDDAIVVIDVFDDAGEIIEECGYIEESDFCELAEEEL